MRMRIACDILHVSIQEGPAHALHKLVIKYDRWSCGHEEEAAFGRPSLAFCEPVILDSICNVLVLDLCDLVNLEGQRY